MINLEEGSPQVMLKQFADYLEAELLQDFGAAQLVLDNWRGRGTITLYELFPGLTAWIYDIDLNIELHIDMKFSEEKPYYFGFNVSGYQLHKFPGEEDFSKIEQGKDFILISEPGSGSQFIIPSIENYKCCYLILNPSLLGKSDIEVRQKLQVNLQEIFSDAKVDRPYRYLGHIDLKAGKYAEILVNNKRTDVVGRLLTEGAIANMLAAQIEAHDIDGKTMNFIPGLSQQELVKIGNIGDYIQDNISGDVSVGALSRHLGVSPRKLQLGIRFLNGCSMNEYITSIRMELARELMHNADMNISEISFLVGITSRGYFSKLFQKRFGVLPADYNKTFNHKDLYYELCYRSFAREGITDFEIENIVQTSRQKNPDFEITGCLIYHKGVFFQIVEGPQQNILQLYENIKKDGRNYDVRTMWKGVKAQRDFLVWDMALLSDRGDLKISFEGSTSRLNLTHLMGNIKEQSFASHTLWRKVRHIIKENRKNIAT